MNKEHGELERKFSTHVYSLWLDENCECVCVCDFGPLCAYSTTLHNMQCILMLLWNFKWTNGWTHITRKFQWFSGPSNKSCMVADEWMRTWYYSIARCPPLSIPLPRSVCVLQCRIEWCSSLAPLYLNGMSLSLSASLSYFSLVFLISATKLLTITRQTWTAIRHKLRFYSAFVMYSSVFVFILRA